MTLWRFVAGAAAVPAVAVILALLAITVGEGAETEAAPSGTASDIPPEYLQLYRAAARHYKLGADGWSYLAGVGKIECDHGRSTAVGCHRGEQNFAGAAGPAQFLAGTWAAYGVDGNDDGRRDIYDPPDAVFGMANYLRASGAPADWPKALFAYNHSSAYVADVTAQAERYRSAARTPVPAPPSTTTVGGDGRWLVGLRPGSGVRCDARIVRDALALERRWGIVVTSCFGGAPHSILGEHPLGLAADISPADGNWDRTMRLARASGWSESCAANGCGGQGPFRVVLYNGYPGHGDPAHTDTPHLHLSWEHAPAQPFTRASWVRTLLPAAGTARAARRRTCSSSSAITRTRPRGAGGRCSD